MTLSFGQKVMMEVCRLATAACVIADGWWWLWTHETRKAYMKDLGLPTQLVYLVMVIYVYFGTRMLFNYNMKVSTTAMIITYGAVLLVIHHPIGEGGIGEYPRNINSEVNFMNILKYAGVIGGVFALAGYDDFKKRGALVEGTQSYAIVLGRAIVGIQYLIESAYFRLYQSQLRTTQINLLGGNPILHVWVVGFAYFFGGLNLLTGISKRKRIAAVVLAVLTAVLTVLEGSTVATSLGIFHMTNQARFHHIIINMQIILACVMAFIMANEETVGFFKKKE